MKHLKDNYDFSVSLRCIVCGSDDCFEFNDEKSFVKCTKCGKEYPGVKGKVDFPQIGLEKGTTERGIPKVSKSCQHYKFLSIF